MARENHVGSVARSNIKEEMKEEEFSVDSSEWSSGVLVAGPPVKVVLTSRNQQTHFNIICTALL